MPSLVGSEMCIRDRYTKVVPDGKTYENRIKASRRGRGARDWAETATGSFVGWGVCKCLSVMKPSNCKVVTLCSISLSANQPDSTPSFDLLLYSHPAVPEGEVVQRWITRESNNVVFTASDGNLKPRPRAYRANVSASECRRVRGRRWYGFTSAVDTFRAR